MFRIFIILLSILSLKGSSQTLGGKAAFNFLHLPSSPLLTAAGGINTSWQVNDAGLAANNPALLKREMHSQLHLSFNAFLGLNNTERTSFLDRVNVDLVMALAVIHHLCIGKNIPFDDLVKMFANMGSYLLIEFVPRFDEKIEVMLQQKKDVYDWYTIDNFKSSFSKEYEILNFKTIGTTKRELFLMKRK